MSILEKILRIRILQHFTFWSISLYFLLRNFQSSSELAPTDFMYTGIFSTFLIIAVYVNLTILIPRFFHVAKYGRYFFLAVLLTASMTYLQIRLFDILVDLIFPGYYLISYFDYWETLKYFIIFIGISSLFHFSKSWFLYKEAESKLAKTQKEKIEAELDALKNQINPHFLFNSLNSIYSLVLKKSERAPEVLIKLSDSMRYIIYEANDEFVDLNREIDFISNYIELQKLRVSDKDTVDYHILGESENQYIAPLLLIPIIENGFKYGIKGETETSFVNISIDINPSFITLHTKNNIGTVDQVERNKPKGTGLANLKKRLELIYPDKHHLNIEKMNNTFNVELKIVL